VGDRAADTVLSLPMHPYLSQDQIERVVNAVADAVTREQVA
jgi:dTDP-4-amino-4,6-dideoxygalactose transaminase